MAQATKYFIVNGISGIWNSYGCIPESGKSVSLRIDDAPDTVNTGSLKDLLGIDGTAKDIGVLAETNVLKELVVMLPMIKRILYPATTPDYGEATTAIAPTEEERCGECNDDPCAHKTFREKRAKKNINKTDSSLYYSEIEKAWLFKIDPSLVNKILSVDDYTKLSIYEIKNILFNRIEYINTKNNIVRMMCNMVNYNFPPHLNWLLFNKPGTYFIPPLAMYTKEYALELYKEDLSDIWQGTMPTQALYPREEESTIEHYLTKEEIFGLYDLNKFKDIKLKIFKCKWHGEAEYSKLLKSSEVKKYNNDNWYQYNWPYDNCSIVEYLQVQKTEIHNYENDGSKEDGVLKTGIEITQASGSTSTTVLTDDLPQTDQYFTDSHSDKKINIVDS